MKLPAVLRRLLARRKKRDGVPRPVRDNPYSRYFSADPTPDQIARRLRGGRKPER